MFLVAVVRPRFDNNDNEIFSEKIDVFPLVQKVASERSSVNRVLGTLETNSITSIETSSEPLGDCNLTKRVV